jgi:5'(3')-deoxyribonucleotidase
LIIALDCDGVLLDCASAVHKAAERILRQQLPAPDYWHSYSFEEAMLLSDEQATRFFEQVAREDSLCWRIHFYPGAKAFVSALREQGHEVYFLTAPWKGMRSWVTAREELLHGAFPDLDVVFTHAKQRATFDLLIDDRLTTVASMPNRAWLFHRSWNVPMRGSALTVVRGYEECLELTDPKNGVL